MRPNIARIYYRGSELNRVQKMHFHLNKNYHFSTIERSRIASTEKSIFRSKIIKNQNSYSNSLSKLPIQTPYPNSLFKFPIQIPYSNSLFKVPIHSPRSNPQIKIPIQNFKSFIQNPHSKSPFKIPIQNPYSKHFRGRAPTPTFLDMLFSKIAFISNAVLIFFSNFIEIFEKICKISKKRIFATSPRRKHGVPAPRYFKPSVYSFSYLK